MPVKILSEILKQKHVVLLVLEADTETKTYQLTLKMFGQRGY
jgi:hypothetical protein